MARGAWRAGHTRAATVGGQVEPPFETRAFGQFSGRYRDALLSATETVADVERPRYGARIGVASAEYTELRGQSRRSTSPPRGSRPTHSGDGVDEAAITDVQALFASSPSAVDDGLPGPPLGGDRLARAHPW